MEKLYLLKKRITSLVIFLMFLLSSSFVSAATITSTITGGNWNLTTTWVGGVVPLTTDNVIIATTGASKVTVSVSVSIINVTINNGATLDVGTRTLTVNGFFTNNGAVTESTGHVSLATGNFTNNGTFSVTSTGQLSATTGSFNSTGTYTQSAGTLRLGESFTYSGTFSLGSAAVQIRGTATHSIQGFSTTGTVSMIKTGGIATFTSNVTAGGLTINGSGGTLDLGSSNIHTFSGTWTRTNGILNCNSSLLRLGSSVSGTGGTFNAGTGTVEYYRGGNQTLAQVTYNNLTLSGSGTKTITTATTFVTKILSVGGQVTASAPPTYGATATLQYNYSVARTVGLEWITPFVATGGVVISGIQNTTINAAKVFNSGVPLTINSGAKLVTGANSLTLGGNFINNGGSFTSSGPIVISNTMVTQTIAGFTTTGLVSMTKTAGTATFNGNVGGAGLTINGAGGSLNLGISRTHTFTGSVTLTNGTLNGGSSTLNVNFTGGTAWAGAGANFTCGTGTVNFGGVAQTLNAASIIFNNLTFSNSGIKTLTSIPTVSGILSLEGTATVSVAPTYGTSAALQYNRATGLNTGPEWITPFVATGGVSTIGIGVITVATSDKVFNPSVPLTIGSGATLGNGGFVISGGSALTVSNNGSLLLSGISSFPVFTTTSLATTSTVNYNGTAQTVAVQNYGNLLLSGSGNKNFVGATTITGDIGISGTAVALLTNGTASNSTTLTLGGVLQSALGSYGGTGSSAINTNATWFGSTTTGIINIISACVAGTWLGLTNSDWNVSTNWCGGTIPTNLTDVIIGVTSNQPIVGAAGGICRNLTILSGATLSVSASNTLTLGGNWTNNGTFTSNASTVNFSGTVPQSIGGSSITVFNNLTNSNSITPVSATNGFSVNNILNIANSTSVLDMGSYALTDGGTFSNTGGGQLKTLNTSSTPIPVAKTWNSAVFYSNSTGGQTIVMGTYNGSPSLELDNTTGTQIASGNIVIGGQLNIDSGAPVFDMNGYNLTTNALNVLAVNSVLDMRGGTLSYTSVLSMDGKVRFSGATNAKPFASGTVEYYGSTQTVTSGNYFKLLFSGVSGVYTMASDIGVTSTLNVTNGDVTLQTGYTLSVDDAVTVVSPGTLTIESSASLLQTTYTGANVGNVIVKRNTTPIAKFDNTFWSSPTTGTQTLLNFSPLTASDRFHSYDSVNDLWVIEDAAAKVFEKGRGYSIRAPINTPLIPTINTSYQFVGVPNNGTFTIPLTTPSGDIGLSFIGNPYPSALNADDFINENLYSLSNPTNTLSGTYYFWSHNSRPIGNDFSSDDYYTCNLTGPTGFTNLGTGNNNLPTGSIASGQGFFVENEIAGNLKFNNTMREPKNNTNFYRTKATKKVADLEKHRLWLNITNSSKTKGSQTMVGYVESATNGFDLGFDSTVFEDINNPPSLLIFSVLGSDIMAIQGRILPFSNSDTVPIGYRTLVNDTFTISLNQMDGLFNDNQGVYLEDKLLNVISDIKSDPYTFASGIGTFKNRFVLRYTDPALGDIKFNSNEKTVIVSVINKEIKINSFAETIDSVTIYDVLGRQIYQKDKVNSKELLIANIVSSQQTLIVKAVLNNGKTVTDKIVY